VSERIVDHPCYVFALSREAHFFRRKHTRRERIPSAPGRAWLCSEDHHSVVMLETGVGATRMEAALNWVFADPMVGAGHYRPQVIVSGGFSGALQDGLRVGDVILASETVDLEGHLWPVTWPGATQANAHWIRGRLLTVPRLIGEPAEKRRLGSMHAALAVDMETATVAQRCSARSVPFGCVRAISDDILTRLSPRLVALLSAGRASSLRILAALISSPRLAGDLWRLARDTRLAGQRLAEALELLCPVADAPGSD
jgi:nucleoside phosphorylase